MKTLCKILALAFVIVGNADAQQLFFGPKKAAVNPIPSGDLLSWPFNEGSGTAVTTPAGTHDADYTGGLGASSSSALLFTRSNSDNAATDAALAIGTNIITVSFWATFATTNLNQTIVEQAGIGSETNVISIGLGSSGKFACTMKGVGFTYFGTEGLSGVPLNTTNHWLIVLNGAANTISNYLNGSHYVTTNNLTGKSSTGNFNTQVMHVGSSGGSGGFFDGKLDDVRIYTGDRSALAGSIYSGGAQ